MLQSFAYQTGFTFTTTFMSRLFKKKTAEIASAFFTKQQAVETATEEGEPPLWQARCKNWAVFS